MSTKRGPGWLILALALVASLAAGCSEPRRGGGGGGGGSEGEGEGAAEGEGEGVAEGEGEGATEGEGEGATEGEGEGATEGEGEGAMEGEGEGHEGEGEPDRRLAGYCQIRIDADLDGRVDETWEGSYDERDQLVREVHDWDGNGTPDELLSYTYANGLRVLIEQDGDGFVPPDGEVDVRTTLTWLAPDKLLRQEIDGTPDHPPDGRPDRVMTWFYGEDQVATHVDEDADGDSKPDNRYTFTNDDRGRAILEEVDAKLDGVIDARWSYRYDQADHLIWEEQDGNGQVLPDGTPDLRRTHTYNLDGLLIRDDEDQGADGSVELVTEYDYDSYGNLLTVAQDTDGDGQVDRMRYYSYGCW